MRRIAIAALALAAGVLLADETCTYDAAGRLLSVDYGNGIVITYTYDKAGNLTSQTMTVAAPAPAASSKQQTQKRKPEPKQNFHRTPKT